jgi:hypothetical protein
MSAHSGQGLLELKKRVGALLVEIENEVNELPVILPPEVCLGTPMTSVWASDGIPLQGEF